MNYIKEINAFYQRKETDQVSTHAGFLWFALMHINNRTGWKKEFTVAMGLLCDKASLSPSSFKRARTELADHGYIKWEAMGANRAAKYELVSLVEDFTNGSGIETQEEVVEKLVEQRLAESMKQAAERSGGALGEMGGNVDFCAKVQSEKAVSLDETVRIPRDGEVESVCHEKVQSKTQDDLNGKVAPLFKQNETKHKDQQTAAARVNDFFENNFCKITPHLKNELSTWVNSLNESLVLMAMKRALERGKGNWGYTKGILQAWVEKGVQTVQDAEQEVIDFRMQIEQKQGSRQNFVASESDHAEIVPDWFRERKEAKARGEDYDDGEVEECPELIALLEEYNRNSEVSRSVVV